MKDKNPVYIVTGKKPPKRGTKKYERYIEWLIGEMDFLNKLVEGK